MSARLRKAIGSAIIVAFMLVYIAIVTGIGARLPDQWLVRLAFYLVAGTAWSLPLIPLVIWMNRGR